MLTSDSTIFVHLLLLLLTAVLWVLYRDLLWRCARALGNDSVMTQLYRRRSGGQVSALWLCYGFFQLSAGLFLYLVARRNGFAEHLGLWGGWLTFSLGVAAAVGLKFVVLFLLGRIFPIRRELSRYSFVLMLFAILAGMLLVPVNLLVSYAPPGWGEVFVYLGAGLLVLTYLLHLLRALFIANRYLGDRPLHFLLYLCTVEIAPLLLIFRYLSNKFA